MDKFIVGQITNELSTSQVGVHNANYEGLANKDVEVYEKSRNEMCYTIVSQTGTTLKQIAAADYVYTGSGGLLAQYISDMALELISPAADGAQLMFKFIGNFSINYPVALPSNVYLDGACAAIYSSGFVPHCFFASEERENIKISGFKFFGFNSCFIQSYASGIRVSNCIFSRDGDAVIIDGQVLIDNCIFYDCGIKIGAASSDCYLLNNVLIRSLIVDSGADTINTSIIV